MAGDPRSGAPADAVPDEVADRLAILQLEAEYARTWDLRDAAGWAACFTTDGAFVLGAVGDKPALRFAGTDGLTEFCRRASGRYEGIHLLAAPSLTFAGDDARGWVHFQYFDRDRKTEARRQVVGVYAVTYVRTGAARWRMRLRHEQAVIEGETFAGFPTAEQMWGPDEADTAPA
ncbi:MAG: nuclear transport factor 2 family protein [Acidimicrobiia bacterium]|jgi:hypothetical protein